MFVGLAEDRNVQPQADASTATPVHQALGSGSGQELHLHWQQGLGHCPSPRCAHGKDATAWRPVQLTGARDMAGSRTRPPPPGLAGAEGDGQGAEDLT